MTTRSDIASGRGSTTRKYAEEHHPDSLFDSTREGVSEFICCAPSKPQPKLSDKKSLCQNYVLLSTLLGAFYLYLNMNNLIVKTSPEGFDYVLTALLSIQYASAVNTTISGALMLACDVANHRRFLDFFNWLLFSIFPIYAILSAAAIGYYNYMLYYGGLNFDNPVLNAGSLENHAIVLIVVIAVINFGVLPLYLLGLSCARCLTVEE